MFLTNFSFRTLHNNFNNNIVFGWEYKHILVILFWSKHILWTTNINNSLRFWMKRLRSAHPLIFSYLTHLIICHLTYAINIISRFNLMVWWLGAITISNMIWIRVILIVFVIRVLLYYYNLPKNYYIMILISNCIASNWNNKVMGWSRFNRVLFPNLKI